MEPPNYLKWKYLFLYDHNAAAETGNDHSYTAWVETSNDYNASVETSNDYNASVETSNSRGIYKDCQLFWAGTEATLSALWKKTPTSDFVILAWESNDEDTGVWVFEPTDQTRQDLIQLVWTNVIHWHEALERCGARYYQHWSQSPFSKFAYEEVYLKHGYRPYFLRTNEIVDTVQNSGEEKGSNDQVLSSEAATVVCEAKL